jgi:hypothetical protein
VSALIYSTYLGGSGVDQGLSIALDKQGQVYVTGETYSTDFPINNALQSVLKGNSDAFVTKLTVDGAALRYSTYLGGNEDGFVAQLTADGAELGYATYLGGRKKDGGFNIAVDQLGQAYVTGGTFSTDFPAKNALQPLFSGDVGDVDAFVTKITADGSAFLYSTYLGGSGFDACEGIAVDEHGQATVTGRTQSLDFPTKNELQPTFGGGFHDVFITQFTADGAALRYSTYLGGSGEDLGSGIAVDTQGQAYVAGSTSSSDFPTKNALEPALNDFNDAFVAKIGNDERSCAHRKKNKDDN